MSRKVVIERYTNETRIKLELNLDGTGKSDIFTQIGFFDHMLEQISKHAFIDLYLNADGDTHVDTHHIVEDVGIVIGKGISEALGEKKGITRYGQFVLPMEDALVIVAVDFSGRPFLGFDVNFTCERIGELETEMIKEFFHAISLNCGMNLHIKMLEGVNNHHMSEAIFKAFAKAIAQAIAIDPRIDGVLSTKGMLE